MNKNKGFSLVELIVVVAIMAVLVGILAPAYLSYVEKTRRGTDENTAEEVRHTVEMTCAEINVYDEWCNGGTISYTNGAVIAAQGISGKNNFKESMEDIYANKKFDLKSKKYKGKTYTVTIGAATSNSGTGAALTVTGAWSN